MHDGIGGNCAPVLDAGVGIADASGTSTQKFADAGSLMIAVRAATLLATMGRQFLEDAKGGTSAC